MDGNNLVGKVIHERYELIEIIGSGGMAVVYKGFDRLMNRNVAFKMLKNSLKYDDEIVEKFSAEAKASAGLSHQNIVTIYDVGQYEGLEFIVMEYIDGITLKEYINENKPLQWRTACEIAIQIAEALAAAHENGIIHRDIKPHNILINKENVAKVADFGIARAVSSDTVNAGGSALGSVYYISPEQARGGYVDQASDIYSLGVVLYEMLTGVLPIDGDNAVSIALKKLEEEPVNPKVINLDIPQELDAVVMKTIAKEQHLRYKAAGELIDDLKALLNEDKMHSVLVRTVKEPQKKQRIKKEQDNKPHSSFNPIIASLILIVILAVGTFFVMTGGTKEDIVPDLLGLSYDEAVKKLDGTEFEIDEEAIAYEISKEHKEGTIFHQTPGANQSVKKNKKIKIKISMGETEGNIFVPDVVGDELEKAKELLEGSSLKYKIVEVEGEEEQLNKVIKQSPSKDTKVSKDYEVVLYVCTKVVESEAEEEVKVPSLEGKTLVEAELELKTLDLSLGTVTKDFSDKEKGKVITQSPKAGETVKKNSTVSIVVSDGKKEVEQHNPSNETATDNTPVTSDIKRKTLSFGFPEDAGETVSVKVIKDGVEIYNKSHNKSEGKVDIVVEMTKDAIVQIYMDGELFVQKMIEYK